MAGNVNDSNNIRDPELARIASGAVSSYENGTYTHDPGMLDRKGGRYVIKTSKGDDAIFITPNPNGDDNYLVMVGDPHNPNGNWRHAVVTQDQLNKTTLKTRKGDDRIIIDAGVDAPGLRVKTGRGNDKVQNNGHVGKIKTGRGRDVVINEGRAKKVKTGAGSDRVANFGEIEKVKTGRGRDTLHNEGEISRKAKMGGGRDEVHNTAEGLINKLRGGRGRDSLHNEGEIERKARSFRNRGSDPATAEENGFGAEDLRNYLPPEGGLGGAIDPFQTDPSEWRPQFPMEQDGWPQPFPGWGANPVPGFGGPMGIFGSPFLLGLLAGLQLAMTQGQQANAGNQPNSEMPWFPTESQHCGYSLPEPTPLNFQPPRKVDWNFDLRARQTQYNLSSVRF